MITLLDHAPVLDAGCGNIICLLEACFAQKNSYIRLCNFDAGNLYDNVTVDGLGIYPFIRILNTSEDSTILEPLVLQELAARVRDSVHSTNRSHSVRSERTPAVGLP